MSSVWDLAAPKGENADRQIPIQNYRAIWSKIKLEKTYLEMMTVIGQNV